MTERTTQPELMDEWGCAFYGKAKHVGDLWYYDDPQDDGTIKRRPLLPRRVIAHGECEDSK